MNGAAKVFAAYYEKVPLDGGNYTIYHTAGVYLFDAGGEFAGNTRPARGEGNPASEAASPHRNSNLKQRRITCQSFAEPASPLPPGS